jgi:hypothetical protein
MPTNDSCLEKKFIQINIDYSLSFFLCFFWVFFHRKKKQKGFYFSDGYLRGYFSFVCHLNNGVQFHRNRVSVLFLQDKREALVDSVLCYLECDIREFRAIRSISGVNSIQIALVVSNAHAIKFKPAALYVSA